MIIVSKLNLFLFRPLISNIQINSSPFVTVLRQSPSIWNRMKILFILYLTNYYFLRVNVAFPVFFFYKGSLIKLSLSYHLVFSMSICPVNYSFFLLISFAISGLLKRSLSTYCVMSPTPLNCFVDRGPSHLYLILSFRKLVIFLITQHCDSYYWSH